MEHVNPTGEQLAALAERAGAGPILMLNLNRYRERAVYPDGWDGDDPDVSGRDAYARYSEVALRALGEVGGRPVWMATSHLAVVGCDHDAYDEVLAVWYPDASAFLQMLGIDWYAAATVHRTAALEHAALLCCEGPAEPGIGLG